jgi:hypothetical protein
MKPFFILAICTQFAQKRLSNRKKRLKFRILYNSEWQRLSGLNYCLQVLFSPSMDFNSFSPKTVKLYLLIRPVILRLISSVFSNSFSCLLRTSGLIAFLCCFKCDRIVPVFTIGILSDEKYIDNNMASCCLVIGSFRLLCLDKE